MGHVMIVLHKELLEISGISRCMAQVDPSYIIVLVMN